MSRPALRTSKCCCIACSGQVCPSVPPNSGAELQGPRAAQPGQFWEQLQPAARDKQKMPFFSWQEDVFRFISYTVRCIQAIIPVRPRPPPPAHTACGAARAGHPQPALWLHPSSLQGDQAAPRASSTGPGAAAPLALPWLLCTQSTAASGSAASLMFTFGNQEILAPGTGTRKTGEGRG